LNAARKFVVCYSLVYNAAIENNSTNNNKKKDDQRSTYEHSSSEGTETSKLSDISDLTEKIEGDELLESVVRGELLGEGNFGAVYKVHLLFNKPTCNRQTKGKMELNSGRFENSERGTNRKLSA
jgi:hypothetical protein